MQIALLAVLIGCSLAAAQQPNSPAFRDPIDLGRLQMGLERRNCEGPCVLYSVTVSGNGDVQFVGGSGMLTPGRHRGHISPQAVQELVSSFRRADYFHFRDQYSDLVTDLPGAKTWIEVNGRKKLVDEYAGRLAGAPQALLVLEDSFDRIAETEKWIKGNQDTLPSLVSEHWDFRSRSQDNLFLCDNAMARGPQPLIDFVRQQPDLPPEVLSWTLQGAAGAGKVSLARQLIQKGADPRSSRYLIYRRTPLILAVTSGNPEMVREMLRYQPDVNAIDDMSQTALTSFFYVRRPNATLEIVKLLIAAGADVNHADDGGITAILHACGGASPELIRILKRAGANLNARSLDGQTPLMWCSDIPSLRALIDAGADLRATDSKGRTAKELACQSGAMVQKCEFLESAEKAAERTVIH